MELFYVFLLSFLLLASHFLFYRSKSAPLPPGKTGWPVAGESLEFLSSGRKGHPEKFVFDLIGRYSSHVFTTHLFGEQAALLCGAGGNKFLFSCENKLVQAWWPASVDKIFPSSPRTSTREQATKVRKMIPNFLKPEALQRYVGTLNGIARRHFADGWENKEEVVVSPLAKKYTFWLACRLFISVEDPRQVNTFAVPFNCLASGLISIPIDLPGTPFHGAIKASNSISKELASIIKRRKTNLAEGKASPTQDVLSHMLLTSDENGKFMHELDIADKILALLLGGYDTASSACTLVVKYLAELPEIYEGVYKEQTEIANSKRPGELLNWEDLQKMTYSWNVACQVLRLSSPLQGSFREALTDFMYNGFSIPKGLKIYWTVSSTHKNSECFPDPTKFDTSRFEGCRPAPYTVVPFGGMFPGREYARLEILVFMHHLVLGFRWEKIIPHEKIVINAIPIPIPAYELPVRLYLHKA